MWEEEMVETMEDWRSVCRRRRCLMGSLIGGVWEGGVVVGVCSWCAWISMSARVDLIVVRVWMRW